MVYSKILIGSVELKAKKRKEKICNVLSNNLQKGLEVWIIPVERINKFNSKQKHFY